MKKVLTALVLTGALAVGPTVAQGATKKPALAIKDMKAMKAKKPAIKQMTQGGGAEGSATHEMTESSGMQNAEGTGAVKKHAKKSRVKKHAKKAGMKKAAKATTK